MRLFRKPDWLGELQGLTVLTLPIGWVFAGIGFLALGEVIRRGRALRDELAGVI